MVRRYPASYLIMNEILRADYSPIRNNPARPAAFLRPLLVRQAVAVLIPGSYIGPASAPFSACHSQVGADRGVDYAVARGRARPGRRRRCRSMRGCVGSGSRCCAGNPDSEPIRAGWRMLSSGPRPVVVSTTTGASSRPLVLRPGRCGVVGGRDDARCATCGPLCPLATVQRARSAGGMRGAPRPVSGRT